MAKASRGVRARGAVIVALLPWGCTSETPACPSAPVRAPHEVRYELAWDDDDGTTGPRTFVTDLGYEVTLEAGELVDYAVQLVPCDAAELAPYLDPACPEAPPRVPPAGHGSGVTDDSLVAQAMVEPLLGRGFEYGKAVAFPSYYCRSHYLVGPATGTTPGGTLGVSLWLDATFRKAGDASGAEVSVHLETSSPWGAFAVLDDGRLLGAPLDTGMRSVTVTLTRARSRMFDGIDFGNATLDEGAKSVLKRLVRSAHPVVATE